MGANLWLYSLLWALNVLLHGKWYTMDNYGIYIVNLIIANGYSAQRDKYIYNIIVTSIPSLQFTKTLPSIVKFTALTLVDNQFWILKTTAIIDVPTNMAVQYIHRFPKSG